MIDKLTKQTAADARFAKEDARACGWHFAEPDSRGRLIRAEKYTPRDATMKRFARSTEEELLEEIFQHERAVFERERREDRDVFARYVDSVNEVVDAYNEELRLAKVVAREEDERLRARRRLSLDGAARRFTSMAVAALDAGQKMLRELQDTQGADVTLLRSTLDSVEWAAARELRTAR